MKENEVSSTQVAIEVISYIAMAALIMWAMFTIGDAAATPLRVNPLFI